MDFPPNPREKPGYTLEFSDEFDGSALDQGKWFPHLLPHWSSLERSAARYAVRAGRLELRIDRDQNPWIEASDRASNLQTAHFSGPKGSRIGQFPWYDPERLVVTDDIPVVRHYTPRFGYFETRIRAVPVVGYHIALWMIGFDTAQAGEIRVFEVHGMNVSAQQSRVDYGILRWNDAALHDELHEDWLALNAAEFHVYGVEWTPTRVDFFVDNIKLRTMHQSPQYKMQFMLGLYERPHELRAEDARIPFPRACEVDYFRAYQPIGGY
jgi:hypothetical protein